MSYRINGDGTVTRPPKGPNETSDGCGNFLAFVTIIGIILVLIGAIPQCDRSSDKPLEEEMVDSLSDTFAIEIPPEAISPHGCDYISNRQIFIDRGPANMQSFYYTGDALNNVPHGFGRAVYPAYNNIPYSTYEGDFRDGVPDGHGTWKFSNGESYSGEFKGGWREGQGQFVSADYTYEGSWEKDKQNGFGIAIWPNEAREDWMCEYDGNFVNGEMTGKGKAYYVGFTYVAGEFRKGTCVSVSDEGTWEYN